MDAAGSGDAESAAAQTPQEPCVSSPHVELLVTTSLEEPITAGPQTVSQNAIAGSSSTFPLSSEKLVADFIVSASALALQVPDASCSKELLSITSSEEFITTGPEIMPLIPSDGPLSILPLSYEKLVEDAVESASALTLQELDVSSSEELLNTVSSEELITANLPSRHCYSASSGPTIWVRHPSDWYVSFYIRMNREGSFCICPDLGGPFQSLKEAEDAINLHLEEKWCPAMLKKQNELPFVERLIQYRLFYPDGTPKRGPKSPRSMDDFYRQRHLVQALLDQYNEDQNLFGDLAYELKDVKRFQLIYEGEMRYYHLNFTTKMEKADGCENLFFAELAEVLRADGLVLSCLCIIKPTDDGHCYGCRNNGNPGMSHPSGADAYVGGHLDGYLPWGFPYDSDEDDEALAARIRSEYEVEPDPCLLEELFPSYKATVV